MTENPKTIIIAQARLSSSRLPGKVLMPLCGKPMVEYLLERLFSVFPREMVVLATSDEESDFPIYEYCTQNGVNCERGPLDDVAGRFQMVIDKYNPAAFVRICADSPLMDPHIIQKGINVFSEVGVDLVTNVSPRSYPKGQSVEVVKAETYCRAYSMMEDPQDREHVTRFLYSQPDVFDIYNFKNDVDLSKISLAVDTKDDFQRTENIISMMEMPHVQYGLDEIMELYRRIGAGQ